MSFHFFSCEEKSQTGFSFIFWDVIIPVIVPHQGLFPRTPFLVPGPGCWRAVRKMWRTHSLDQTSMRMGSRIIRHHLTQVRLLFVVPITEKALSSHLQFLFTSGYRKRHPGKKSGRLPANSIFQGRLCVQRAISQHNQQMPAGLPYTLLLFQSEPSKPIRANFSFRCKLRVTTRRAEKKQARPIAFNPGQPIMPRPFSSLVSCLPAKDEEC